MRLEEESMEKLAEKKETKEVKSGVYIHQLSKPIKIEKEEFTSLEFRFNQLTGADIEAIEEELQDQNRYVLSPEISSAFQTILAAKAAGIPSFVIRSLPVIDYMKIKNKARDFLAGVGY